MLDMAHQSIKEKNGNHLEFPFCRWPRGFALVSVFTKISGQILPIEFKFFPNSITEKKPLDRSQKIYEIICKNFYLQALFFVKLN